jgi:putative thioredoxin
LSDINLKLNGGVAFQPPPPILEFMAIDVAEADFEREVVDRSREVPVVVDFWAEWCGPCRVLTPVLEKAVESRDGKVVLAKVDTDANPTISRAFGVRGIPAVMAFRDGKVVDEFVGAQPAAAVERFLDGLVPSEADALVAEGDEQSLRRALELEPNRKDAAAALARILLGRGEAEAALALVEPIEGDFAAEGLAARARLALADEDGRSPALSAALEALDREDLEQALASLAEAIEEADGDVREQIRRLMVGIFTELGPDHPLSTEYRRKLAAALY